MTQNIDSQLWDSAIKFERARIKEIISKQTVHYGKTHYEGIDCYVCRINHEIDGENE